MLIIQSQSKSWCSIRYTTNDIKCNILWRIKTITLIISSRNSKGKNDTTYRLSTTWTERESIVVMSWVECQLWWSCYRIGIEILFFIQAVIEAIRDGYVCKRRVRQVDEERIRTSSLWKIERCRKSDSDGIISYFDVHIECYLIVSIDFFLLDSLIEVNYWYQWTISSYSECLLFITNR